MDSGLQKFAAANRLGVALGILRTLERLTPNLLVSVRRRIGTVREHDLCR
jgi:hypothetical protein